LIDTRIYTNKNVLNTMSTNEPAF